MAEIKKITIHEKVLLITHGLDHVLVVCRGLDSFRVGFPTVGKKREALLPENLAIKTGNCRDLVQWNVYNKRPGSE